MTLIQSFMDNLENLEMELLKATEDLVKAGESLKKSAKAEADFHSAYDLKKNKFLVLLYNEEIEQKIKRTVDQRVAMYRTKFSEERRDWLMAKADYESDRDLYRGVQIRVSAIQTLIGVEKEKMKLV